MSNERYSPPRFGFLPQVIKNLLIINVLLFVAEVVLEKAMNINLIDLLGLHYVGSDKFAPYQFVTHMFMHGDFFHLLFNMLALFMLGKELEFAWGPKKFLFYYFVTGLGAAALHSLVTYFEMSALQNSVQVFVNSPSPELFAAFMKSNISQPIPWITDFINQWISNPNDPSFAKHSVEIVNQVFVEKGSIPTVGASGAIFGVLLAFGYLFPNVELMLLFFPVPIKAKYFVLGYGAIELYLGITESNSNIAHFAHLGGMLFGFFLLLYWKKKANRHGNNYMQ
jgi:membrane associated rhomboid family serine protease